MEIDPDNVVEEGNTENATKKEPSLINGITIDEFVKVRLLPRPCVDVLTYLNKNKTNQNNPNTFNFRTDTHKFSKPQRV